MMKKCYTLFGVIAMFGTSAAQGQGTIHVVTEGNGDISEGQSASLAKQRWSKYFHAHTGQTVETVLRGSGQYTTFLALIERARLLPLLTGTVHDTAYTKVTFVEGDLGGASQISSTDIQIPTFPGADMTAVKSQFMNNLVSALNDAAKVALAQENQITIFAPTNAAFDKLSAATRRTLEHDSTAAARFVRAHIVNRGVYMEGFPFLVSLQSLAGTTLTIGKTAAGAPTIDGIPVSGSELVADNGAVHGLAAPLPTADTSVSSTSSHPHP